MSRRPSGMLQRHVRNQARERLQWAYSLLAQLALALLRWSPHRQQDGFQAVLGILEAQLARQRRLAPQEVSIPAPPYPEPVGRTRGGSGSGVVEERVQKGFQQRLDQMRPVGATEGTAQRCSQERSVRREEQPWKSCGSAKKCEALQGGGLPPQRKQQPAATHRKWGSSSLLPRTGTQPLAEESRAEASPRFQWRRGAVDSSLPDRWASAACLPCAPWLALPSHSH